MKLKPVVLLLGAFLVPTPAHLLAAAEKAAPPAPPVTVLVKAGFLVDVVSGTVKKGQEILVENGVIKEVGPNLAAPAGTRIVDPSRKTGPPGPLPTHTPIPAQPEDSSGDRFRRSSMEVAVSAHVYAKRTLDGGFTALLVVGAEE